MARLKNLYEYTESLGVVSAAGNSATYDVTGWEYVGVMAIADVMSGAKTCAAAGVSAANDTFTITAHGYLTGTKLRLTTSGTLPSPLLTATDYYVIKVDADTIKLATSAANATAGTAIDLTDVGTGTTTFTPNTISGASVRLWKSNDGTNWDTEGSATNITADGSSALERNYPVFRYYRIQILITDGSFGLTLQWIGKGHD